MASYCDNCGEKVYNGACVNCHEEVYIQEQYIDLEMEVPDSINKKVGEFQKEIEENRRKTKHDVLCLDYNSQFTYLRA